MNEMRCTSCPLASRPISAVTRVVTLLNDRVREGLRVTEGAYSLGLSDETIERLMKGVTAGVLYAFSGWHPDSVREGAVHAWGSPVCGSPDAESVSLIPPVRRHEPQWPGHADEDSH